MKRTILFILLLIMGGFITTMPTKATIHKRAVDLGSAASPCLGKGPKECAKSLRRGDHDFGVAVKAKQGYTLDNVWVKIRKSDGSNDRVIAQLKDNVTGGNMALIQFKEEDVADVYGWTVDELRQKGFQIRPKIESLGAGSGRQDKGKPIYLAYDTTNNNWTWAKSIGGKSIGIGTKWSAYYKSTKSVNDVGCEFDGVSND